MDKETEFEKRIEVIEKRNLKVEADKAWETSLFRILTITIATYIIASIVLWLIGTDKYFLGALIPTIGYFLSVQTLPLIKKSWTKKYLDNNQ